MLCILLHPQAPRGPAQHQPWPPSHLVTQRYLEKTPRPSYEPDCLPKPHCIRNNQLGSSYLGVWESRQSRRALLQTYTCIPKHCPETGLWSSDCCLSVPFMPHHDQENHHTESGKGPNQTTRQPRHINTGKEVTSGILGTAAFLTPKRLSAVSLLSFQGQESSSPFFPPGPQRVSPVVSSIDALPRCSAKQLVPPWPVPPGCSYLYCTLPGDAPWAENTLAPQIRS